MSNKETVKKAMLYIIGICIIAAIAFAVFVFQREDKAELHVYTWSDYISPEVVEQFEKENDCRVVIDTFDDNESMLAKMQAGATGYDVIFPSSYIIPVLNRNNLIRDIDPELIPNVYSNFDAKFNGALHEYSMKYSVPYAFSITGIAVRRDKLAEEVLNEPVSWELLRLPVLNKRVSVLNDIREMIGIGLKVNGYSLNSTNQDEIAKGAEYATTLKKAARRMDNVEYRIGLVDGTFIASIGYNSDIFQVKQENPEFPIEFIIPKEGSSCCWDEMCIPTSSKHQELAHRFINFIYDEEVAAKNMEYVGSIQPNSKMWEYLSDDLKADPLVNLSKDTLGKVELLKDVGEAIEIYNRHWDVVTNSK